MRPRAVRGGLGDRPRQEARDKESAAGIAMENVQSMDDSNLRDDITGLEARIEALADSMDRCRKIAFASKLVVAAGAVWIALMALGAIPFAPVNRMGEIYADEHLRSRGFFVDMTHPVAGGYRIPGVPFRSEAGSYALRRPAPRLGEHNGELLAGKAAR